MHSIPINIKRITPYVSILLLSYIVSGTALSLSSQYDQLRFFNKYILAFGVILTVVQCFHINWLKDLRLDAGGVMLVFFVLFAIAHDIIYGTQGGANYSWMFLKVYILYILIYLNVSQIKNTTQPLMIILGCFCFSIGIFYCSIFGNTGLGGLISGPRIHTEALGFETNINTISYNIVAGLLVYIRLTEVSKKRFQRILWILFPVVSMLALFLTLLNRSVGAALLVLLLSVWNLKSCSKFKMGRQIIFGGGLALLLGCGTLKTVNVPQYAPIEPLIQRMGERGSYSLRKKEALNAWAVFTENPILGNASRELYGHTSSPHANHLFHLNVLAIYGIIGFAFYFAFVVNLIRPGRTVKLPSQWMACVFFLGYLFLAPPYPLLAVPLLVMRRSQPVPLGR
jgi:hypothetical protein